LYFQTEIGDKNELIRDMDSQCDELNALLTQATSRADEKELLVFELEEQIEKLNGQIERLNGQIEKKQQGT
jgi:uncharacterized small protein (DUF1192 family)